LKQQLQLPVPVTFITSQSTEAFPAFKIATDTVMYFLNEHVNKENTEYTDWIRTIFMFWQGVSTLFMYLLVHYGQSVQ
jgi:hypothetical protein